MATFSTAQEWELLTFTGSTAGEAQTIIGGPSSGLFNTADGYQYMLLSAKTIAISGSFTNVNSGIVICENIGSTTIQYFPTQTYNLTWRRDPSTNNRSSGIFQYNMNDGSAIEVSNGVLTPIAAGSHQNHIPYGFILTFENTNAGGISTSWVVQVARYK